MSLVFWAGLKDCPPVSNSEGIQLTDDESEG